MTEKGNGVEDNQHFEEDNEEGIVILTDEDGEEHAFEIVEFLDVNGKEYAILLPQDEFEEDEPEAVILRVEEDSEGDTLLIEIDDDDEWESVSEAWEAYLESDDSEDIEGQS